MVELFERLAERRPSGRVGADSKLGAVALASVAVVVGATLLQVSFGAYPLSLGEAWGAVFDPEVALSVEAWRAFLLSGDVPSWFTQQQHIVWNIRLPRILVGVLVGANLAVSGAVFQIVTRNELASPYILGVSDGAGLVVLTVLTGFSGLLPFVPVLAAFGGGAAFLLVYVIAWKNGTSPVRLVLAGVIVGTVFGSVQRALFFFIDDLSTVMSAQAWLSGSLLNTDWGEVRIALPFTVLALALAFTPPPPPPPSSGCGSPSPASPCSRRPPPSRSPASSGSSGSSSRTWSATSSAASRGGCSRAVCSSGRRCWSARTSARASRSARYSSPSASSRGWSAARTSST